MVRNKYKFTWNCSALALMVFSVLAPSATLAADLIWDQGNWDEKNWYSGENPLADSDSDGIVDSTDNCPLIGNPTQVNTDGDSQGDACDADDDNDSVVDGSDNCPLINNASQLDSDSDGQGNVCDANDDNDGVPDISDAFPLDPTEWLDTDGDGIGDNADLDADSDGVPDATDNCLLIANANQLDTNSNGIGDACEDADSDNDGVANDVDNCPDVPNSNQADLDGDNVGDKCDDPAPLPVDNLGKVKKDARGVAVAFAGDFNGDGYGDYVVGIPKYDVKNGVGKVLKKDAGRAEVISGKDGAVIAFVEGYLAKDAMGTSVAGGARINNDAYDDVVIGSPKADDLANGLKDAGSVTILYGRSDADLNPPEIAVVYGVMSGSLAGSAVALANVNNDGQADIIIGAPKADDVVNSIADAGSVTVFDGNTLSAVSPVFYGASLKAYAGSSVAVGDVDGDGLADIIIGAPGEGGVGSMKAYNLANDLLMNVSGESPKSQFGKSVAVADVNNDGVADVLVGAPGDDDLANMRKDAGSVSVFYGNDALPPLMQYGAVAKVKLGASVAAGDVDADGYEDIIAGAPKDDKPGVPKAILDVGSVSVWSGKNHSRIGGLLYGSTTKDYFGSSVAAGDINSDGRADLVIGVPGFDFDKSNKDAGKVVLFSGEGF